MALKITLDTEYEGYKDWLKDAYRDWEYDENEKYGGTNEGNTESNQDNKKTDNQGRRNQTTNHTTLLDNITTLFRIPFFSEPRKELRKDINSH